VLINTKPPHFLHVLKNNYDDCQILNVDETGVYSKKIPSRTSLAKNEESQLSCKVSKESLTLLLEGNAEGDFKLKVKVKLSLQQAVEDYRVVRQRLPHLLDNWLMDGGELSVLSAGRSLSPRRFLVLISVRG
jgi:hypothetical protein